ncbi:MAG: DUF3570 domain-containing protein [Gammaproteobacteria bacterium]|nr:DUF3570 domain-containing protein [Gammaproteobacteria bacterium]
MEGSSKKNAALALTASALTIFTGRAGAESPPDKSTIGVRYSNYTEEDISSDLTSSGETEQRYDIDVRHVNLFIPLTDKFAFGFDAINEKMTGASPIGNALDGDEVKVVMSGATIEEDRTDLTATMVFYGDHTKTSFAVGQSNENDYLANYASVSFDYSFNQDNTTLGFAVSHSDDEITPTDAEQFGRIAEAEKTSSSVYVGVTHLFSPVLMVQTGVGAARLEGFLSDPYKAGNISFPQDRRPDERNQYTYTVKARYFLKNIDSAFHADYRYFTDNWDIDSHTVKLGIIKNFTPRFQMGLTARYYMQSEAEFYEPFNVADVEQPEFFSSDYRLSPFGALSFNLSGKVHFEKWAINFNYERYKADSDLSFEDVVIENPGLIEYDRFSLGFTVDF